MPEEINANDILWHYCPNQSFLNIIESKEIWLSEITHSNDYMEGRWLIDVMLRKALLEGGVSDYDTNMIIKTTHRVKESYNAFAFCLSQAPDVLSQWRGYADDGRGVAIGFNRKYLESLIGQGPNQLPEVKYSNEDQLELIGGNEKIQQLKDAVDREAFRLGDQGTLLGGPPSEELQDKRKKAHSDLLANVFSIALKSFQAKNPAFQEEEEWRLIQHNFMREPDLFPSENDYYDPKRDDLRVIAQSGVLTSESSGDQIDLRYLNTVFELYPGYHLGQVVEAA